MRKKKRNPNFVTLKICHQRHSQLDKKVSVLQNDMGWVREKLDSVDKRTWVIVTGIIISVIIGLANFIGG